MDKIIELACKSLENEDVPIGAIIKKNGEILSCGYNTRNKDHNILGHAEINAIINAQKKINNWNLSGCEMYVTLKPCSMCFEVIKQSRINVVYYLLDKPDFKHEFNKTCLKKISNDNDEKMYVDILSGFFKKMREKKKNV